MLLFTSYLLITGLAMFFTSFVSSRLGAKKTLLIGLALIVIFAAAAGASDGVGTIIGFRAGWGLGNALFISTALATIVGAASGGVDNAIILYEAALGLGIAIGPLLGGALGSVSWRGPFFGTAVLMALGLISLLILLGKSAERPKPVPLSATFAALRHPALLTLGIGALFYNFGFFSCWRTARSRSRRPRSWPASPSSARTSWAWSSSAGDSCVAITSVFVAPPLTRRFGRQPVLYAMLALLAADLTGWRWPPRAWSRWSSA